MARPAQACLFVILSHPSRDWHQGVHALSLNATLLERRLSMDEKPRIISTVDFLIGRGSGYTIHPIAEGLCVYERIPRLSCNRGGPPRRMAAVFVKTWRFCPAWWSFHNVRFAFPLAEQDQHPGWEYVHMSAHHWLRRW